MKKREYHTPYQKTDIESRCQRVQVEVESGLTDPVSLHHFLWIKFGFQGLPALVRFSCSRLCRPVVSPCAPALSTSNSAPAWFLISVLLFNPFYLGLINIAFSTVYGCLVKFKVFPVKNFGWHISEDPVYMVLSAQCPLTSKEATQETHSIPIANRILYNAVYRRLTWKCI